MRAPVRAAHARRRSRAPRRALAPFMPFQPVVSRAGRRGCPGGTHREPAEVTSLFRDLLIGGFVSMLVFVSILLLGLAYAWRKGVLTWR